MNRFFALSLLAASSCFAGVCDGQLRMHNSTMLVCYQYRPIDALKEFFPLPPGEDDGTIVDVFAGLSSPAVAAQFFVHFRQDGVLKTEVRTIGRGYRGWTRCRLRLSGRVEILKIRVAKLAVDGESEYQ